MGQKIDRAVTVAEIQTLLPGVTRAMVFMWAQRGKVRRLGHRGQQALFAWSDVATAERDTRLNPRRPREATVRTAHH